MSSILDIIKPINLLRGSHAYDCAKTGSGCFMNVACYLNGEPISDTAKCVHPGVAGLFIFMNDNLENGPRQSLLRFIPRAMKTGAVFSGRDWSDSDAWDMFSELERIGALRMKKWEVSMPSVPLIWTLAIGRLIDIDKCLEYLDKVLPQADEVAPEPMIERAQKLVAIAEGHKAIHQL